MDLVTLALSKKYTQSKIQELQALGPFIYKGSVASYDNLPTSGMNKGDVWTTLDTGDEYLWSGTAWVKFGSTDAALTSAKATGGIGWTEGDVYSLIWDGDTTDKPYVYIEIPEEPESNYYMYKISNNSPTDFMELVGGIVGLTQEVSGVKTEQEYTLTSEAIQIYELDTNLCIVSVGSGGQLCLAKADVVLGDITFTTGVWATKYSSGSTYLYPSKLYKSNATIHQLSDTYIPNLSANKITSGQLPNERIASAATWNAKLGYSNKKHPFKGLCFTANTAFSTITLGKVGSPSWTGSYSTDGINWTTYVPGTTATFTFLDAGYTVYFKGSYSSAPNINNRLIFSMTGSIAASGNIMSLCSGDNFESVTALTYGYEFYNLFNGCTALTIPPDLPATSLSPCCYYYMFYGCTSLIKVPDLPARTLEDMCYRGMFSGCTSLYVSDASGSDYNKSWRIPSTGVSNVGGEMKYMFQGCLGTRSTDSPLITNTQFTYYTQNVIGSEINATLKDGGGTLILPFTNRIDYLTTAPTAANTDGLKIVVLSSEPATKYNGYIYFIQ